jgi:DNA-binding transcriptional MerR regulator
VIDGTAKSSLSAGELARRAGVSPDTLRHYERKGVIQRPPRQANGYRIYPSETLRRVELVRRSLAIGFTLDELAKALRIRDQGGAPCRKVRELAVTKLGEVEERLKELLVLRDELRATLKEWDRKLAKAPKNLPARLLESLSVTASLRPKRRANFTTTTTTKKKPSNKRQ